eukprot:CAMPEP_0119571000 /NCGR_PEP_ID=MMETSP1352-20130426/43899_1 /TAXON_ID=265584 /ORGANISM="Stauroneis constricta, Strain CCMP1120" /LENGTH=214 /DNA_ID=CAMNT_0007620677 /DNA_START=38 /DNA_END=682 /DNA_ORIENTATION=+
MTPQPQRSMTTSMTTTLTVLLLVINCCSIQQACGFAITNHHQPSTSIMRGTVDEIAEAVNGEVYQEIINDDDEESLVDTDFIKKRVPVLIRYSADSGLKPFYLTVAKRINAAFPDVLLDKAILPADTSDNGGGGGSGGDDDTSTFEILVDGKLVASKNRKSATNSVFVSMNEVGLAVSRARRRRRPATVYGEEGTNLRLEMLRRDRDNKDGSSE